MNVLTFIDHVDKEYPDYRVMYDRMCEYAHPNWYGTHGHYTNVEKTTKGVFVDFQFAAKTEDLIQGVSPFILSLGLACDEFNQIGEI